MFVSENNFLNISNKNWTLIAEQSLLKPSSFEKILLNHGVTKQTLIDLAIPSISITEPYGRKIIYKDNSVEVMIAKWSYKFAAAPHNHGHSRGLILFIEGNFIEQQYIFNGSSLELCGLADKYSQGEVATVLTNDIHSCQPETTGISLHLYSPPITKMKVWDTSNSRTLVVADNCGAWVPNDEKLVLDIHKWN